LKEIVSLCNVARYIPASSGRKYYHLLVDPVLSKKEATQSTTDNQKPSDPNPTLNASDDSSNQTPNDSPPDAVNDQPQPSINDQPPLPVSDQPQSISTSLKEPAEEVQRNSDVHENADAPTIEVQNKTIRELLNKPQVEGETRYLISAGWFQIWKEFVGFGISKLESNAAISLSSHPGPIDNSSLVKKMQTERTALKSALQHEYDYIVVSSQAWESLVSWYGGGPEIPRLVVQLGFGQENLLGVELYPLSVSLSYKDQLVLAEFSRVQSLEHIREHAAKTFNLDPSLVQLFLLNNNNQPTVCSFTGCLNGNIRDQTKFLVESKSLPAQSEKQEEAIPDVGENSTPNPDTQEESISVETPTTESEPELSVTTEDGKPE